MNSPQSPRLAVSNANPNPTRAQWEERVFRQASYFAVASFTPTHGVFLAAVKTFPEAVYLAGGDDRRLIFAVTGQGEAFCMPPSDYERFAQICLAMRRA